MLQHSWIERHNADEHAVGTVADIPTMLEQLDAVTQGFSQAHSSLVRG
jgi:hypothetical protein